MDCKRVARNNKGSHHRSRIYSNNMNADYYTDFLLHRLPELLENVPLAQRIEMLFQQDGHPAHTSRLARTILNKKFPGRWIGLHGQEWPPRSPNLTPMDIFVGF